MALSKRDREFRLRKISYLELKQLDMDRVLTALFARLAHNGYPSRLGRNFDVTTEAFVEEFLEHPEWFSGFQSHRDILARWIETDLMDMVNRGKPDQAIASPRPLHGFTYRFRNKQSRSYGGAQHLYEMLYHARGGAGQKAIEHLHYFFFQGHDKVTGLPDNGATLDVETQALLRLVDQVSDTADTRVPRESFPPLCVGSADLLAEDVMRLLCYQGFIPRSVMVEYLKVLLSFHLALYHLRLFKLLPSLVRRKGVDPTCAECPMSPKSMDDPHGDCQHRPGLLVDVASRPGTPTAALAERSADAHYRRIPSFVKAYFITRKMDEFATDLVRRGKLTKPTNGDFSVGEVLQLLGPTHTNEREVYFAQRVYSLTQDSSASADTDLDPELRAVVEMGLNEFDTYIEMLVALRGRFHGKYVAQCMDSLLMKNRPGALVAGPRAKGGGNMRFVLDSRLLEVLLQLAVLRPGGTRGYHTGELRVDGVLTFLCERYGLYVDRLPPGDGFGTPSITDRRALRANRDAFVSRLREVGFYRDLSDAYVTQTVTPRYQIDAIGAVADAMDEGGKA
ncbi:hypothetical protein ACFXG4_41315 [Nocardia sp. NPDC059246]|uniref:methylation-associated defense system protein MAD7 n=1 Tax=unclassified Nocardia TaxID=2637762 RepID=UPI0036826230